MPDTPQSLALDRYMAFQNSGGDAWGDKEREQQKAIREQAEIDARANWMPVSGFDPFTNAWEAKFVPPEYALEATKVNLVREAMENDELHKGHPGARSAVDPFNIGLVMGRRAVGGGLTPDQAADNKLNWERYEQHKREFEAAEKRRDAAEEARLKLNPWQQAQIDSQMSPETASRVKSLDTAISQERAALLRMKVADFEDDRKNKRSAQQQFDTAETIHQSRITDLNRQMDALLSEHHRRPTWETDPNTIPAGAPRSPQSPQTGAEVNALDMFGRPGERTPFAFSGGSAPPAVGPPIRRRRYNPSTGRLE